MPARRDRASRIKRPCDTEAHIVVVVIWGGGGAVRRADLIVDPRSAAGDPAAAFFPDPCGAVCRGAGVATVVAILHPLPDVAMHVVETKRIGLERSNRGGLPGVPFAAAAKAIGVALADLVAPRVGRGGAGARRVFPFGFGEQT